MPNSGCNDVNHDLLGGVFFNFMLDPRDDRKTQEYFEVIVGVDIGQREVFFSLDLPFNG